MQPFVVGQELEFRQEATKRTLLDLFESEDYEGLFNAAMLLNSLWHQQTAIARCKVNGQWLFTRRFLQVHYRGGPDLTGEFANTKAGLDARGAHPQV